MSGSAGLGESRSISGTRRISAPASVIFDILANPARHSEIDGSGTVKASASASPQRLGPGSRFGMKMRIMVPYRMSSRVVEFEEGRLIAWAHFGGHRWRYELEPDGDETVVTETFDWSTSKAPKGIELAGYPARHQTNIEATLERLEAVALSDATGA